MEARPAGQGLRRFLKVVYISYGGRLYQLKKQSSYHPPCKSAAYIKKIQRRIFPYFTGNFR
jgi:hypothetical protein